MKRNLRHSGGHRSKLIFRVRPRRDDAHKSLRSRDGGFAGGAEQGGTSVFRSAWREDRRKGGLTKEDAYFNLGVCVELYPVDKDLADGRERFVGLKNDVRGRLSSRDAGEVEGRVAEHVAAWQKKRELDSMPASGLGESPEEDVDSEVGAEEVPAQESSEPADGATQKNGWKMPVVISLAGAGVVSGVVGGVMFGVAGGHQGDADDLLEGLEDFSCAGNSPADDCAAVEDTARKRDSAMNMGTGFVIAGGGLLVGSLVVALAVPSEKPTETGWRSVRPDIKLGGDGMALGLSGRF